MSAPRLVSVAVLLLAACAAWETTSPSNSPPPAENPTPSHYAPPPPGDPRAPYTPPPPEQPRAGTYQAAVASVQLNENCVDPEPAPAAEVGPSAGAAIPVESSQRSMPNPGARAKRPAGSAGDSPDGQPWRPPCTQSMVQLSVRADFAGSFKIEAARVLDANSKKAAGTVALRLPTLWSDANGTYTPWDARTVANQELKISYKMGEPDFSRAAELALPNFSTFMGPFILELDVTVDGRRQTIRSSEFSREPPHVIVT